MTQVYEYKTLPILIFREISEGGDHSKLFLGSKKLSNEELELLGHLWVKIFYEYLDDMNDETTRSSYVLYIDIIKSKWKYKVIYNALTLYLTVSRKSDLKKVNAVLKDHGYIIDTSNPLQPQLDNIVNDLKILKSNIDQDEISFNNKFKRDQEETTTNVYKEAVVIEKVLGKKDIDVMTTVCPKWVQLVKLANETAAMRKEKKA